MQIRIKQYSFQLSSPFFEGRALTEGEAAALNALRAENIRNNLRAELDRRQNKLPEGQHLDARDLAELQQIISQYDANYKFLPKHLPVRFRASQVELEAEQLAREELEIEARQQGSSLADWEPADVEIAIQARACQPRLVSAAKLRIQTRQAIAQQSLEDLI